MRLRYKMYYESSVISSRLSQSCHNKRIRLKRRDLEVYELILPKSDLCHVRTVFVAEVIMNVGVMSHSLSWLAIEWSGREPSRSCDSSSVLGF